jgi:uncharacterized protein
VTLAARAEVAVPPLSGRVNDLAGLLPPSRAAALERKLEAFERETSHQVVLLTVPSLGGEEIEDFSMRVAEAWKIGHAGLDNGVIVLVAPHERRVRIEVGYGLEGVIPDVVASRIIRERMTPLFAQGRMADGIEAGLDAVMAAARGEEIPAARRPQAARRNGADPFTALLASAMAALFFGTPFIALGRRALGALVGAVVAVGVTWLLLGLWPWAPLAALFGGVAGAIGPAAGAGGRGRRGFGGPFGGWGGGGWSGGGSSGGGFSGGGGGFGGGGASGSW